MAYIHQTRGDHPQAVAYYSNAIDVFLLVLNLRMTEHTCVEHAGKWINQLHSDGI